MKSIFPPYANLLARCALVMGAGVLVLAATGWYAFGRSSYITRVGLVRPQPVPFSHKHHVEGLGIDCRYCHTSVETSAFAGMPPSATCMNCHTQIWSDSPMLAPVRRSYATKKPLVWVRVHDMPDFVYFNHSAHIAKGVGCVTCHGRVDQEPLMKKNEILNMGWCLDCHRNPAPNLRPRDRVFDMTPPVDQTAGQVQQNMTQPDGRQLMSQYHVRTSGMDDCMTCHR